MIKLSRRRWAILSAAVSAVIVVALFLPTVIGGWAPLLHYTCQQASGPETTIYAWVPGLMINTPYGGEAFGNGTVPAGPLSASGGETVYALGESNGSAAWAGFRAEINVSSVQNQTAWGPGQNVPCTAPFAISVSYWGGEVLGGPLLGAGNVSDSQESTSLDHWTYPGDVNLSVSNGFVESNSRSISTCGTGPASNLTSSPQFEVKVPYQRRRSALHPALQTSNSAGVPLRLSGELRYVAGRQPLRPRGTGWRLGVFLLAVPLTRTPARVLPPRSACPQGK